MTAEERLTQSLENVGISELEQVAEDTARAFELASERIANALQRAAMEGEFSFSEMVETISRDLAWLAVRELISDPLEGALNQLGSSLISSTIGQGATFKTSPVNVTVKVSGVSSVSDFKKSETQLAAGLARALSQSQKLT